MKPIYALLCSSILCLSSAAADSPRASMKNEKQPSQAAVTDTLNDIKSTLGVVPTFFKQYPPEALPQAWALMKNIQLSDKTAIPPKYKDLIGLALASQIPCRYCAYFHTESAKLNGAQEPEIQEAVALAANERLWSTFINGIQTDESSFRADVDQMMKTIRERENSSANAQNEQPQEMRTVFNSPQEALSDMQNTLGVIPGFVKKFPEDGIAGAWGATKALLINPSTAIPAKYKDLIALGVSAQIPCSRCVYMDTEAAKLDGAEEKEINEAVAVASISRHWSTVLNGMQTNDATFKREMGEAFAHLTAERRSSRAQPMDPDRHL